MHQVPVAKYAGQTIIATYDNLDMGKTASVSIKLAE
jgi:hypothetical protein